MTASGKLLPKDLLVETQAINLKLQSLLFCWVDMKPCRDLTMAVEILLAMDEESYQKE